MKNPVVILIIPLFLLQGCGNVIDPAGQDNQDIMQPCNLSKIVCLDTSIEYHTRNSLDTLIEVCDIKAYDSQMYFADHCASLKIVRDYKTLKSMVTWCATSGQAAAEKMTHFDFCKYTILTGNILKDPDGPNSYYQVEFNSDCPDYTLSIINLTSGTGFGPFICDFLYVVPVLPDSVSIKLHVEIYNPVDSVNTYLYCSSDDVFNEY